MDIKDTVKNLVAAMGTADPARIAAAYHFEISYKDLPRGKKSCLVYDLITRRFSLTISKSLIDNKPAILDTLAYHIGNAVLHCHISPYRDEKQEQKEAGEFSRLLLASYEQERAAV